MNILLKLAYTFMKIGLLTIGGGLAMIPIVQHEMERHGWLTHQQFLDILGVSQMTPGPLAVNTATFVGYRVTAAAYPGAAWLPVLGALCCTIAVCLPSMLCVNAFGGYWTRHRDHPCLQRVFSLLRPIVTGLVITASATLIASCLWGDAAQSIPAAITTLPDLKALVLALLAFLATAFTKTSPVLVLLAGLLAGVLFACV